MKRSIPDVWWVVTQLVIMGALLFSPPVWPIAALERLHGAGVVIAVAGLVLSGVAAWQLRAADSFTSMPTPREDAQLLSTGMYGRVRHPIYSCLLLSALGVAMAMSSVLHALLFGVLWLFFNAKAAHEEAKLAEKFADYAQYAARTPRFIPLPKS